MEYLLKSVLISSVIYLFYKLFLQKETFFQSIRWYFLIGIILSLLLPLLIIPIYVEVELTHPTLINQEAFIGNTVLTQNINPLEVARSFNWTLLFATIYFIGIVFLLLKFTIALFSLLSLIRKSKQIQKENYTLVETDQEVSPFSFFNYIVFSRNQFSKEELNDIIAHEKVHVNQKHSIDNIVVQLFLILQWINPFVWFYRNELIQNLEYIADKEAQNKAITPKKYQYLLLKTSVQKKSFALSNNFFNSQLKKRIMMLQKSQTKKSNQVKYVLLIPLITVFLYGFNIKEVYQIKDNQNTLNSSSPKTKEKPNLTKEIIDGETYLITNNPKIANLKSIMLNSKTSQNEIKRFNTYYKDKTPKIRIVNVKRNHNKEIVGFDIQTKFEGQKRFVNNLSTVTDNVMRNVKISKNDDNTFLVNYLDEKNMNFIISKIGLQAPSNFKFKNNKKELPFNFSILPAQKDKYLIFLQKQLKSQGIDFQYKNVERNKERRIIGIDFTVKSKTNSVSYSSHTKQEIEQVIVSYNEELTILKIGESSLTQKNEIYQSINHIVKRDYTAEARFSESKPSVKDSLKEKEVDPMGYITFKEKTYFYNIKNEEMTFFNKYGEVVELKLAKEVLKQFNKDHQSNYQLKEDKNKNFIHYNNQDYFYLKKKESYMFFDKYGHKVNNEISEKLKEKLNQTK